MEGPGTAVRVTPDRRRADEWAVVLAAAAIPHWLRRRIDGWALIVPPDDADTALATLAAYDQENAAVDPVAGGAAGRGGPLSIAGPVVSLLLIGFYAITGPRAGASPWFERGSADASRILAGEWWRAITALTLHADPPHLLGNAVALAGLGTAVCWSLGQGVGLWLLLLAGVGGNLLTAAVHGGGHVSVGASTAVFGAIGILAALRILTPARVGSRARTSWIVVAASLALLALLGTGVHADVLAHLFGVVVGGGLGALATVVQRRRLPAWLEALLVLGAAGVLAGAWRLAL
jgi:membrane associated rhomboid family serine protease